MQRSTKRSSRTHRSNRVLAVAAALALLVLTAACAPPPGGSPVPAGDPGVDGPCTSASTRLRNPADTGMELRVLQPVGDAAPWTGGTCGDDSRPVVLFAHGYFGSLSVAYQGILDHLVSNGFVVVFPAWPVEYDPEHWYDVVDTGFVTAVEHSGRVDTDRVGVMGHSMGGGMTPWLLQQAAERGWGGESLWAVHYAAAMAHLLPSGPIEVPEHTRVAVVGYEHDPLIDNRIGIELLQSYALPAEQRTHVMVRTDRSHRPVLWADHFGPVGFTLPWLGQLSVDHLHRWGDWRVADATARCSMDGTWCDADLGNMGTWPDGRAVQRSIVSHDPVDLGPIAMIECSFPMNPRPCPRPPA